MNGGIWVPLLTFVPFFFWLLMASCRIVPCPNCGWRMGFGSPPKKTTRQFLAGGGSCPKCGCEMDNLGNKIDPAVRPRFPVGMWVAAGVSTATCIALTIYLFRVVLREPPTSPAPAAYSFLDAVISDRPPTLISAHHRLSAGFFVRGPGGVEWPA